MAERNYKLIHESHSPAELDQLVRVGKPCFLQSSWVLTHALKFSTQRRENKNPAVRAKIQSIKPQVGQETEVLSVPGAWTVWQE